MLSVRSLRLISSLPNGLSLRKFEHGKSRALIVALSRRSELHTIFLSDLLRLHRPKCVLIDLPADHPWMIEAGKGGIDEAWGTFLKTARGNFLVRPRPELFEETFLTREKIATFHESCFLNSTDSFEASPHVAYTKHILAKERAGVGKIKGKTLQIDAFITPLLWMHNNREETNIVAIGGLPELVYRDQIVRQLNVHKMREYFTKSIDVQWNEGGEFSLQQHDPELFLRPRAAYLSEMIRLACVCFDNHIAVVESEMLPLLEEEWKKVPSELRPLKQFFHIKEFPTPTPFVDHVEMHVLLDLMLESFLQDWYIPFKIYPYSAFGTLGAAEAFYGQALTTWDHFYSEHLNAYREAWAISPGPGGRKVAKSKPKKAKNA